MSYSGSLTLTQPAAYRIYQRDTRTGGTFGKGAGAVALTLSPTAPVTLLEAQLRDASNPGTVLVPWFSAGSNLAAGTQTVPLTLPANAAWYLLDLRANGDPASVVSTSNQIGVGEVIAAAGQSLATDFWSTDASGDPATLASLGVVPSSYSAAFAAWNGNTTLPAWATPADGGAYRSSFAAEFLRRVVAATGVNAALVGYAVNGTTIATWQPGQPNDTALRAILTAAGGKFAAFIWCQGHQDAKAGANGAVYLTALQQVIGSLAAAYSGPFRRILCSIPSIGAAAAAKFDASAVAIIRAAHLQYVGLDPLASYVAGLDVTVSADGIHPSQRGNIGFADHFYRAFMATVGGNAAGDGGPRLIGATRAPGSARIVVSVFPAVSLSASGGSAATQFQVFPAGQTSGALPVAGVDLSQPGSVAITLSAAPSDNQALDVWYRLPWDSSAAIAAGIYDFDTDADGLSTGRQLSLAASPLTVSPAVWHRPALVGPGLPMLAAPGAVGFAL
ncbi:MAG: hypothetical protein J0H14_24430 [Alphaproteobacteria bacterium]|nr:hypothetical protein [Alphaproteobacteria bacterium]